MKTIYAIAALFSATFFANAQEVETKIEQINNNTQKVTFFHDNGNIMHQGDYVNGKSDGAWKSYNEDGVLTATGNYSEGKKSGKWIFVANNQTKEVLYSNNIIVNVKIVSKEALVSN